jgi:type IV pilus assembly protein PilM
LFAKPTAARHPETSTMPPPKGYWGIDIGQCALKALRLETIDGKPTATAFDYVEHPKILSQPDADPDLLIREALEKFLSRNEIKHDEVAIGIAGQSGLARFVKLPPVEEKKIGDIVKFEAKQQIPFPLDEVVWDYQKIAGGDVTDGFAMETEIGLFAMKKDVIARYLGYFTGTKIEVHVVQMSPLALVNYAHYEVLKKGGTTPVEPEAAPEEDDTPRGKQRCVVVLDIGTEASNLIITDGGKIIWQRPIPLGGNNFTRALTKELKLTFAKAEHLKRNAAKSPELNQILKALRPVLQDFVGEVQRSLGYFTNTHRNAHVAYMIGIGSAFRLPGLQKYLSDKLTLDVKKPVGFNRLDGDTVLKDPLFIENLLSFPVCYGLALQAMGEARLTTNLLPAEIRTDRLIREKKPYAVAAAAALLLGTAGLALGYGANYKAVNDPAIKKGIEATEAAKSAFGARETAYSGKISEIESVKGDLKKVVDGQDERLNWPRFEEVFTAALPRAGTPADGGNLPEEIWRKDGGFEALQWFQKRMRQGVPIELAGEDARSRMPLSLAMVNVEAVYPRWVDNLPQFFQNADNAVFGDAASKSGFGENIARFMKPGEKEKDAEKDREKPKIAEGGGWVIEIRGYTDNKDGEQFIRNSLLANLQRIDEFVAKTDPKDGKVRQYLPGVEDPVKGKMSHAFIYHVWDAGNAMPNTFKYITRSYLDPLVSGSSAGGAAGGAPGTPGSPGLDPMTGSPDGGGVPGAAGPAALVPSGPSWVPLTSRSTASASGSPGMPGVPGSFGMPGETDVPGSVPMPDMPPPGSSPDGGSLDGVFPTPPPPSAVEGPPRRRYEFVVMFVWREPVPTPERMAAPAAAGSEFGMPGS